MSIRGPITIAHSVSTIVADSPRARALADLFDLPVERPRTIVEPIEVDLRDDDVVLITGPSGSGKSTILRQLREHLARRGLFEVAAPPSSDDNLAVVDAFDNLPLDQACALLGRAGLGEAYTLITPIRQLSDGQRYRLLWARLMQQATDALRRHPHVVLYLDEFGTRLDRLTRCSVARLMGRWARRRGVLLIVASVDDTLAAALRPSLVITTSLTSAMEIVRR